MDDILRKFDLRIHSIDPHIVALLTEIDGIRGEFKSGLRMTPQSVTNLRTSTIITSAGASTRIEGSTLTDAQVEKIMHGLSLSKFADRDTQEVQGYLETLQNVFDSFWTLPLRESVILSLHHQLLKYSTKDETHRGGYKTTPAYLAGKEMQELTEWTSDAFEKKRFHQLLIIANFIVEFLKIHPFEDGNGRLSRVLTNLLLLRSGYQFVQYVSHEQIVERRKDEYYFALRTSQETLKTGHGTIAPWLNFFLAVVGEQATRALSYLEEEHVEDTLSPKQYDVWKYLSSVDEAAPGKIVNATGIALGTVRQALARLVILRKVKRMGQGRGTRYVKV